MLEKIRTGIEGLDIILDGGIPRGHCVLLSGSCGTGKTILSQKFLFTGAKEYGEPGLYVSLSEPKDKMLAYLQDFEFFDRNLVDSGVVQVVDLTQDERLSNFQPLTTKSLMNAISAVILESKAKRVVIDSVTAICNSLGNQVNIRDFLFELSLQLRYIGCTSILISEVPPMTFQYSVYGIEEFITDGVILMRELENKGDLLRTLQVVKMRGVAHSRTRNIVEINSKGIELKPMFEL